MSSNPESTYSLGWMRKKGGEAIVRVDIVRYEGPDS